MQIKKYLKIWWRVARMSLMCDMAYKWDFLSRFGTGMVWMVLEVVMIYLIYSVAGINEIAGFGQMEIYLVWSFYQLVMSMVFVISPGLVIYAIFRQIHFGGLDFFIIKPVNLFFLLVNQRYSLREFAPTFFMGILGVILIMLYGNIEFDFWQWTMVLYVIVSSIVLLSVLYWIAVFVAFFVENAKFLISFVDEMSGVGIYPKEIYAKWMQNFLLFVLPFLLVANPIYNILENKFDWKNIINSALIVLIFVLILKIEWGVGLRKYNSAA
jgi:ABC-2 type transport system permease protein